MAPELRLPIVVWIGTSVLLLVWAARSEGVVHLALAYVVLNGGSLAASIWRDRPVHPKALQVLAWCTAAQLPTLLVIVFDANGSRHPRQQRAGRNARRGTELHTGLWPENDDSNESGPPV